MTKRYFSIFVAVVMGMLSAGCYSPQTTTFLGPRKVKVVDASTKRPICGAKVEMSGPGGCMGQVTNERGLIWLHRGVLYVGPKMEKIDVTMPGYDHLSLPLTNGLPNQVEITPVRSH